MQRTKIYRRFKRVIKVSVITFTVFCLFLLVLSFTSGPFWIYYWLGNKNLVNQEKPEAIVLLSGGGMPSEDGLYRVYCASEAAKKFPGTEIIISMPGDTSSIYSSIFLTNKELLLRGIDTGRIKYASTGTNTRSQALEVYQQHPELSNKNIILVTAPIHMRRAVLTFEKAGFNKVLGYPTFERIIESDLSFDDKNLGGNKLIPDVGNNINLRYRFWGHLKLEVDILREFFALGYYWLKGWI